MRLMLLLLLRLLMRLTQLERGQGLSVLQLFQSKLDLLRTDDSLRASHQVCLSRFGCASNLHLPLHRAHSCASCDGCAGLQMFECWVCSSICSGCAVPYIFGIFVERR